MAIPRTALIFLLSALFSVPIRGAAQEVLLQEDVHEDTTTSNFGAGRTHFVHLYTSVGSSFGPPDSAGGAILPHRSVSFDIGVRYKLKILERWEMGLGVRYTREAYALKQNDEKVVFGDQQYQKEKLILNDIGGNLYTRFVFGKRGNFTGTFLDLGVFGDFSAGKRHLTVYEFDDPNTAGAREIKSKRKGLTFVEDLHYGFMARIGYGRYAFYGRFRYSDLWKDDGIAEAYPELPRFNVGFQIGMHQ